MDWYVMVLRLVHILAGAFWLGSAVVFFLFLEPAAQALGAPGEAFMRHVNLERGLPIVIGVISAVALAAGALLYLHDSSGLSLSWITSAPGLAFTIGGLAAFGSWLVGFLVSRPAIDRMAKLSGSTSGDAATELGALAARVRLAGAVGLALLVLAVAVMSVARYL